MTQTTCTASDCTNGLTGQQRSYCSKLCASRDYNRKARERGDAWTKRRTQQTFACHQCGKLTTGPKQIPNEEHKRRYCSPSCQREGFSVTKRGVLLGRKPCHVPWKQCDTCHQPYVGRPKAKCPTCCVGASGPFCRVRRPQHRVWFNGPCRTCGDQFCTFTPNPSVVPCYCSIGCAKYQQKHRRRVLKRRSGQSVSKQGVFVRDGFICQLCGEPTSERFSPDDMRSPTLDHIVPLARGGDHTYENTQCAHWICNSIKGVSTDGTHQQTVPTQLFLAL